MCNEVETDRRCVRFPARGLRGMMSGYITVGFRRLSVLVMLLIATLSASPALAALCADSSLVSADQSLKRQLTAVRNMERGRKCTAESAQGGFFNACRDLAMRRGDIQSKLEASAAALARCSGTSLTQAAPKATAKAAVASVKKQDVTRPQNQFFGQYSGTPLLFCVRLSDGYYFPAPHSQYARSDQIKETLAQCSFICETSNVNLYILNDPAAETADMLSVDKRESYASLPTAYRYQSDSNFNKCNWAKYNSYIQQVKFGREKGKKSRTPAPAKTEMVKADSVKEPAPARDITEQPADRAVRIIGPAFLQDGNDELVNFGGDNLHTDAGMKAEKSIE